MIFQPIYTYLPRRLFPLELAHVAAVYTNRGDCDVSCDACRSKAPATAQKTYKRMSIPEIGAVGITGCEYRSRTWI